MKVKGVLLESKYTYHKWLNNMPWLTKGTLYEVIKIEHRTGYDVYWFYDDELELDFTTSTTDIFDIYYQV